jgi:gamma-glutamylcyclotransferase (GGCT)/AIG2-like uncharacterized protein YtfP
MTLPAHFFFYGTLMAGHDHAVARMIHAVLEPLGPATGSGRLYAIRDPGGWYPVLVAGDGQVRGQLYAAGSEFGERHLSLLDGYEGYLEASEQQSHYLRVTATVTDAQGAEIAAQAYRFNAPVPANAEAIPDGDFAAWIVARGGKPFGG